jgi:hypothetical protein
VVLNGEVRPGLGAIVPLVHDQPDARQREGALAELNAVRRAWDLEPIDELPDGDAVAAIATALEHPLVTSIRVERVMFIKIVAENEMMAGYLGRKAAEALGVDGGLIETTYRIGLPPALSNLIANEPR